MEAVALIVLGLVALVIILPIAAMVRASNAKQAVQALDERLRKELTRSRDQGEMLLRRLNRIEEDLRLRGAASSPAPTGTTALPSAALAAVSQSMPVAAEEPVSPAVPATRLVPQPAPPPPVAPAAPPPLPVATPPQTAPAPEEKRVAARSVEMGAQPASPAQAAEPAFTLEQFMGVKLFAWVGGLALFLGLVFFVKLSIERGWISAELRTAIGFVAGLGLVAGGVRVNARKGYAVLGQTLCATGVVVLYGMTFAAHAFYKFAVFREPVAAFGLMALITTAAFLLAVRMSAQVVAVLGMVGGFLTPILCSTGQDNPLGLFGYIALLDVGVLAVAKRRRWLPLTALAAAGTLLMQLGWHSEFFQRGEYAFGAKTWVPVTIYVGFAALFAAAAWKTRQSEDEDLYPAGSALALCGGAMFVAFQFLGYGSITERPWLLYGFVLVVNLISMAVAWKEPRAGLAPMLAGIATFAHLAVWTMDRLAPEMLPQALAAYLVFGLLQTSYGVLWQRRQAQPMRFDVTWMPVVTLLLLLIPVLRFDRVSFLVWPALLVVDLGIIVPAMLSRSLLPVFSALLLTLLTAMCWLFKLPAASASSLTFFLLVLGGFAIVFAIASCLLARKVTSAVRTTTEQEPMARWLPVCSAVLPFALLVLAMVHLRVANPSPAFGLALLLNLFLLGLSRITRITALPMAGLLCTLGLEAVWHAHSFDAQQPMLPLLWYLGFHALFTLHPHLFRRHLAETTTPWATAALAGAGTFPLVYALVDKAWPNDHMGLLPLVFAVPQLASLFAVLKLHRSDNPARMTQLAWFGGMALLFITLIFPIQFEKQWITVSWALEGAALCWLFRRVPHPGLRATGAVLLAVAFARLALNPAVLEYHVRGEIPIWNWQLYAYGLTALAAFLAAWWLDPPRHIWNEINLRGVFTAFGGILLFLLLNIEIADAFTPPGSRSIAFDFDGNFGRDMTYSIAWALFALALLVIGFAKESLHTRYTGIALLAVTLLKLFFHDLAQLDSVYRIGALIAVSLIALAASSLYQRSLSRDTQSANKP